MGERLVRKDWSMQIFGYFLFLASMFSLLFTCDFPLFADTAKEDRAMHALYFQILCIHALTSTHMTVSMMFAHVTKRKYEPLFGNRLLCFVVGACTAI